MSLLTSFSPPLPSLPWLICLQIIIFFFSHLLTEKNHHNRLCDCPHPHSRSYTLHFVASMRAVSSLWQSDYQGRATSSWINVEKELVPSPAQRKNNKDFHVCILIIELHCFIRKASTIWSLLLQWKILFVELNRVQCQ